MICLDAFVSKSYNLLVNVSSSAWVYAKLLIAEITVSTFYGIIVNADNLVIILLVTSYNSFYILTGILQNNPV